MAATACPGGFCEGTGGPRNATLSTTTTSPGGCSYLGHSGSRGRGRWSPGKQGRSPRRKVSTHARGVSGCGGERPRRAIKLSAKFLQEFLSARISATGEVRSASLRQLNDSKVRAFLIQSAGYSISLYIYVHSWRVFKETNVGGPKCRCQMATAAGGRAT